MSERSVVRTYEDYQIDDHEEPTKISYFDPQDEDSTFWLPIETWVAWGRPEQLTVTIAAAAPVSESQQ